MLWLAVTNLAKEFDLYSRFRSVVLVLFLNLEVATPPPFKILLNDIHSLTYELVLNYACRRIGNAKMAASTKHCSY